MTPQERDLIRKVAREVRDADRSWSDPDAVRLIQAEIASQPGFAYLLTQRVIVQELALQQAQAKIAELEAQQKPGGGKPGRSFLGSPPVGTVVTGAAGGAYPVATVIAPPSGATPGYGPPQAQQAGGGGGGAGGFLKTAAAAAAGTVAANLIFDGIQHYFHGHAGYIPGFPQSGGFAPPPAYDPGNSIPPAYDESPPAFLPPADSGPADYSGGDFPADYQPDASGGDFGTATDEGNYDDPADWSGGGGDESGGDF